MAQATTEQTQALHDQVRDALVAALGSDAILQSELQYDFPVFVVKRENIIAALRLLKDNHGYNFLTTLCGLHYPHNKGQELGVMYQLHNMPENKRVRFKIFFPENDAEAPTATVLWPTANWMERQEFDFFGIKFKGHPNLKRILNMDDITFFPLRKEFPLEDQTRDDKDDSMFGR
jgi:NADH-quinone oxidoreductase subunit C